MPAFPLIKHPQHYRPCIQDLLADGAQVRDYWLTLFENHCTTLAKLPTQGGRLDEQTAWSAFRHDYLSGLTELRREPNLRGSLTVLELTIYRDEKLAAYGFDDPFSEIKQRENNLAIEQFITVLHNLDARPRQQKMELLARGLFAGNLFDMGSAAAVGEFERGDFDFFTARDRIHPRPWPVDDLDIWLRHPPYQKTIFFVDNSGPDIVLGVIPLVISLVAEGTRVVLAANSKPALNDITAPELLDLLATLRKLDSRLDEQIRSEMISVVPSGCRSPLIDLSNLTKECCDEAAGSDLVILEGMGRAIESNYDTEMSVDTLKLALIKDPMVAKIIGVQLFDPIFRYEPA